MTQKHASAFIFPAFIHEYPENPFSGLEELNVRFHYLLAEASSHADQEMAEFDFSSNHFPGDELTTQYLTYIYSCAAAEVLSEKSITPDYSAGYSMGIYAALVQAHVLTFADGLLLIKKAYEIIRTIVQDIKYGMCSIIGLSRQDIDTLILSQSLRAQIANQNSDFAFVISGRHEDLVNLLETATAEGALHTHLLNVSLPYHSDFLIGTKLEFSDFLQTIRFSNPQTKIISLIDQKILQDNADIREEVIKNLFTPLNWYQTQSELLRSGVNLFVECGLGKNLAKNSKFIEGEYQFLNLSGFLKKMEHG